MNQGENTLEYQDLTAVEILLFWLNRWKDQSEINRKIYYSAMEEQHIEGVVDMIPTVSLLINWLTPWFPMRSMKEYRPGKGRSESKRHTKRFLESRYVMAEWTVLETVQTLQNMGLIVEEENIAFILKGLSDPICWAFSGLTYLGGLMRQLTCQGLLIPGSDQRQCGNWRLGREIYPLDSPSWQLMGMTLVKPKIRTENTSGKPEII